MYVDNNTHRLIVVPHRPDCWQLDADRDKALRAAADAREEKRKADGLTHPPHEPDWYHDGVESEVSGRLCRTCRLREPEHP